MINFERLEEHGQLRTDSSYQHLRREGRVHENLPEMVAFPHVQSTLEILCVRTGKLWLELDGNTHTLLPGDAVVINPFRHHACYIAPGYKSVGYYCVLIELAAFSGSLPKYERELALGIADGKRQFRSIIPKSEAAELHRIAAEHFASYSALKNCRLACATLEILAELFENFVEPINEQDGRNIEFIRAMDELIRKEYASPLTTAEIAGRLSYSESYFCRLFKESFGMSFMKYIVIFRLLKAASMKGEPRSIVSIAEQVGFNDYSYFSRAFKHYFLRSPSEFFEINQ